MIHSTLRILFPAAKVEEALEVLSPMAERIKVVPGCLGCHVYMDLLERDVLMVQEMWRNKEDLTSHLRSSEYRKVLLLMEMALERPEVRFDVIEETSGFEIIEQARS